MDLTYLEAQDEDAEGALSPVGHAGIMKLSFACLGPDISLTDRITQRASTDFMVLLRLQST